MSLTILRWQGGMCGDTVLKLILLSNPHFHCQNQYADSTDTISSRPNISYARSFEYDQIGKMSMQNYLDVNLTLLKEQLALLAQSSAVNGEYWILKSHVYNEQFDYRTIDITGHVNTIPFVVNSNLVKKSRVVDKMYEYHPLMPKIKDPDVLNKFHMFNMAKNLLNFKNVSDEQLHLEDILGGWSRLTDSLRRLGFALDQKYKLLYQSWLEANQAFMPSQYYKQLVTDQNFDYNSQNLSIYERYCLLALSGNNFKVLI
jgi:hypothetical protein